jgi:hypothetical protein
MSREPVTAHIFLYINHKPECDAFFLDSFTPEDGSDRLSQNVRKEVPLICCVISQKSADLIYFMAEV